MKLRKRILKFYKMLKKRLDLILDYLFPQMVCLEPWSLASESSVEQLFHHTELHILKGHRVIWNLPKLCIDKETNQKVDCRELYQQKMIERLKKKHQPT